MSWTFTPRWISFSIALLLLAGQWSLPGFASERLDGKVLRIAIADPLPESMRYSRMAEFSWTNETPDQVYRHRFELLPGEHIYDLRGVAGWRGTLNQSALSLPVDGVKASLKFVRPSMEEELEILQRLPSWSPHLVNHLDSRPVWRGTALHQLAPWAGLMALLIARFWTQRQWNRSLAAGVVVAMLLVALVQARDRWSMARGLATGTTEVELFGEISKFGATTQDDLRGHRWSMTQVDRFHKYGVLYEFAESPYAFDPNQAEYMVTMRPQFGALSSTPKHVGNLYLERVHE